MSKKVAKFADDIKDILSKKEETVNHGRKEDENVLLASFVKREEWKNMEYIGISCKRNFHPADGSIWCRLDDGNSPIYAVVSKKTLEVIGDADYIEWNDDVMDWFQNLNGFVKRLSVKRISFEKCSNDISEILKGCSSIKKMKIEDIIGMENIRNAHGLFSQCVNMNLLKVRKIKMAFNDISFMFNGCKWLNCISLRDCEFLGEVEHIESMFEGCINYCINTNVNQWFDRTDWLKDINVCKVKSTHSMFKGCEVSVADLSAWNTASLEDASCMFEDSLIGSINLKGWNTENLKNTKKMFSHCRRLKTVDLSDWDTASLENAAQMFLGCSINSIDLSGWDTSSLKFAQQMFGGCLSLTAITGIESWNTSALGNASDMFTRCEKIESLDLSGWDTRRLRNTAFMFLGCRNLKSLNLHGWKTSRVTNMEMMFEQCESLEELDISTFKTSAVLNMYKMFKNCKKLKTIDLSHFAMGKCLDAGDMFDGCTSLVSVDISGWKLRENCTTRGFFNGCKSLVFADTSVLNN